MPQLPDPKQAASLKDANFISVLPPSSKDQQKEEKPVDRGPLRDKNGVLTQYGMDNVIEHGGGVLAGERVYTRKEDLPSEEALATYAKGVAELNQKTRTELAGAGR